MQECRGVVAAAQAADTALYRMGCCFSPTEHLERTFHNDGVGSVIVVAATYVDRTVAVTFREALGARLSARTSSRMRRHPARGHARASCSSMARPKPCGPRTRGARHWFERRRCRLRPRFRSSRQLLVAFRVLHRQLEHAVGESGGSAHREHVDVPGHRRKQCGFHAAHCSHIREFGNAQAGTQSQVVSSHVILSRSFSSPARQPVWPARLVSAGQASDSAGTFSRPTRRYWAEVSLRFSTPRRRGGNQVLGVRVNLAGRINDGPAVFFESLEGVQPAP